MKELLSRREAAEIFGVKAQTISNWCSAGLLKKMSNGKKTLILGASVNKLIKEFKELPSIEREISKKMDEVKALRLEVEQLKREKKSIQENHFIWRYRHRLFNTLIEIYANFTEENEYITNRTKDILLTLIGDDSQFGKLEAKYGLTRSRIKQIAEKGMCIIQNSPCAIKEEVQKLRDENFKLKMENQELKYACIDKKWEYIKYLQNKRRCNEDDNNNIKCEYPIDLYERGFILGLTKEQVNNFMEFKSRPVEEFNLTVRALHCLMAANIETIGDIVTREKADLLKLRYFGRKSSIEVDDLIEELGLTWGINEDFLLNG